MVEDSRQRQWSGKTGGGNFGQRFLFWFLKRVRVKFLYPVLYLVVPFYCIVNHKAFGCIYRYFKEIHHFSGWKSLVSTVRNHLIFGHVVLDRFAIMAGNEKQFDVDIPDAHVFNDMLSLPHGFIVAGAHIGNFEAVGHFFNQDMKKINILVFDGENPDFQARRQASFLAHNVNMIPVKADMSHIFAVKEALDHGEIVAIVCDRMFGSTKAVEVEFIGRQAKFPLGAFLLAAQWEVPVVALSVVRERGSRYRGFVSQLPAPPRGNIRSRSQFFAREYAAFLEDVLRQYPEQWFNFYDFWE